MRSGILVMGIHKPMAMPIVEPIKPPTAIQV